ncbi:Deleted in malignant brain tumors 1 protein, partial [Bulinus truncatus]
MSDSFIEIDLENDTSCYRDSVEIFQDIVTGSQSLGIFCGNSIPRVVQSSSNNMRVVFKTDGSVVAKGFYASFYSIASSIPTCIPIVLPGASGSFTSPNYPNNYVDNIFICWIIYGSSVSLRFSTFDLEFASSCVFDYVQVFNGPNDNYQSLGKFCGSTIPIVSTSTNGPLYVVLRTDGSVVMKGFHAIYSTTASCGGKLTASSGTITSPGYPTQYVNNLMCAWSIETRSLQKISFRITDIALELHSTCFWDYVDVYDGPSSNAPRLLHTCDSSSLVTIRSTGTVMYVIFRTDFSVTNRGFSANYEISNDCAQWTYGSGCTTSCLCVRNNSLSCNSQTGQCTCKSGWTGSDCSQVIDPCNPNPCSTTLVCLKQGLSYSCLSGVISVFYHLTWKNKQSAHLTLFKFFDGSSTNSRLLGKYCGSGISAILRSTTNSLKLTFMTDISVTKKGFLVEFKVHSCANFMYGSTCELTCSCVQANTNYCDNINGLCVCKSGFTGARCSDDIDECQSQNTISICPSNSQCQNTMGGYNCTCKPGFILNSLGQCQVNNNCGSNAALCSHSCYINSAGKQQCVCPDNLILEPIAKFKCLVPFYPNGQSASDSLVNSTNKDGSAGVYFSKINFSDQSPFGTRLWKSAYVLSNGIISFTSPTIPREPDFSAPNQDIIAPFWSKMDSTKGSVYYHLYEKCEEQAFKNPGEASVSPTKTLVMERAAKDVKQFFSIADFDVSRVLVTTWLDVSPLAGLNAETTSFQLIYVSGNRKIGNVNTDQFS